MPENNKIKVLIVDDEKIIRDFLARLLALQGLEVSGAQDGIQGVEMVKNTNFDFFFIDMRMPGMDGLDTFRGIRKINPNALAVMMTGYAVEDLLDQAIKEGALGVIRKPFDIGEIKDMISKFSQGASSTGLNVLIVDDEDVILTFFSNFMRSKNIKFKVAHNKQEAMDLVKKEKFNLIFLDLLLKDINGTELSKEIKTVLPDADIALMTGYPQKAKEMAGIEDMVGCLYKPFEIQNIIEQIEKAKSKIK